MDEKSTDVLVAGGGISGLTTAWHLAQSGLDVALLEAGETVGGCMRTAHRDGFLLEKGPFNVIVRDPAFEELLGAFADELTVVAASRAARSRYLYRHGRLLAVPTNPVSLLASRLLSTWGKCRALSGLLASRRGGDAECTIEEFAVRRFGRQVCDTMVSAFVAGILAGDIRKLSLEACFPPVAKLDRQVRSPLGYGLCRAFWGRRRRSDRPRRRWRGLVSIDRGLGALCDAIGARLGDDLLTGCRVESLEADGAGYRVLCRDRRDAPRSFRCRRLVLAVPAGEAAQLLLPLAPTASRIIKTIASAPVTVLNLAFRRDQIAHPLEGFGFLVPHNEPDFPLMGVLWADSAFPHHGREGYRLVRVFIGGTRSPEVMSCGTEELVATATASLRDVLGVSGEPALIDVCPYPAAIPQYYLGHAEKVARLRAEVAEFPGLHLAGNYLEGVSVNDCVRLGKGVAQRIIGDGPAVAEPVAGATVHAE